MPVPRETFEQGEERYSIEHAIIEVLRENREQAYNVHEIATEVLEPEWAGASLESDADFGEFVDCFLDLATVSSILDALVDDGVLERRMLDLESVERSHYRVRSPTEDGSSGRGTPWRERPSADGVPVPEPRTSADAPTQTRLTNPYPRAARTRSAWQTSSSGGSCPRPSEP